MNKVINYSVLLLRSFCAIILLASPMVALSCPDTCYYYLTLARG